MIRHATLWLLLLRCTGLAGCHLGFWHGGGAGGVPLRECRVLLRGVPLARWRGVSLTHPLHYCVVQGYDQARHSVASVMAVLAGWRDAIWAYGMGALGCRGAILASGMGTWGRSRVRHDAEAWVPVAGWTWCGMGRKTARRFL